MTIAINPVQTQFNVSEAIAAYNAEIERLKVEMESRKRGLVQQIFEDIEQRDPDRAAHCLRVSQYAADTAVEMGLDLTEVEEIRMAAIFHDYGALNSPPEILAKQDAMNSQERLILRTHVLVGAQVLASIRDYDNVVNIIENHYEWFDGNEGYPGRRTGHLIPIGARILAVANAYDALITRRPGRPLPLSSQDALMEIMARTGTQYDPDVLEAFRHVI
jgi:putative nucleotidyltransferase with HDIG domain